MAEEQAISLVSETVPAHVSQASGLGNENVTGDHLQTPRVKLLQQLNNEVDENHGDYIEGAKPGNFINSVTRDNYGRELYVINIHFTEDFVLWRKRDKGGGLLNTFKSYQDAVSFLNSEGLPLDDHEVIQTQSHLLLKKDSTSGELLSTPFIMDFASSKLRVSREWNTQIKQLGGDRFSSLWKISAVQTQNRAAQKFWNLSVENMGWVVEGDYNFAREVYGQVNKLSSNGSGS
tara:strand:- start:774 stop:1472 length:699 start_codon:yes stop_codon:yes gene_type:complete